MITFSPAFDDLLKKTVKGREHLKLTIGTWVDGNSQFYSMDAQGNELDDVSLRYDVGSITKTVTASLLAKQVHEGKLSLEASLAEYIDGLPAGYYPTLLRLATHVSGYGGKPHSTLQTLRELSRMHKPDGLLNVNPYYGLIDENALRQILKGNPLKDRDYRYQYSNFAYGVLGYIVGKTAGGTYWDVANDYVQNELGLKNTWLGPEGSIVGYSSKNVACRNWQWKTTDLIAAAGALSSDVKDMLAFTVKHATNEEPYFALSHTKQGKGNKEFDMGLAWRLERDKPYIWHDGAAGAFSCFIGFDKTSGNACAILTNHGFLKTPPLGLALLDVLAERSHA